MFKFRLLSIVFLLTRLIGCQASDIDPDIKQIGDYLSDSSKNVRTCLLAIQDLDARLTFSDELIRSFGVESKKKIDELEASFKVELQDIKRQASTGSMIQRQNLSSLTESVQDVSKKCDALEKRMYVVGAAGLAVGAGLGVAAALLYAKADKKSAGDLLKSAVVRK